MMPKHATKKKTKSTPLQQAVNQSSAVRLFYIALGILVLSLSLLIGALVVQQRAWAREQGPAPAAGYPVGMSVNHGVVTMEVKKVTSGGSQPGFASPVGKHYLIVTLWLKNRSDQPINVFPSTDTYVKDNSGAVTYLTPYGLNLPFHSGALLPGESVEGQLSYLTSSTSPLKFYVDAIWSGGVVPFTVQ